MWENESTALVRCISLPPWAAPPSCLSVVSRSDCILNSRGTYILLWRFFHVAESVFFEVNVFPETDCRISVSSEDIFNEYDGEAEYLISEDTLQSSPPLRHLELKSLPKSMLLRDCDCDDIPPLSTTGTAERVNSMFPYSLSLMKQLSEFF